MNSKLQHKAGEVLAKMNAAIAQARSPQEVKTISIFMEDVDKIRRLDLSISVLDIKPSWN